MGHRHARLSTYLDRPRPYFFFVSPTQAASSGLTVHSIYITDGTREGTKKVGGDVPPFDEVPHSNIVPVSDKLFFVTNNQVWVIQVPNEEGE